MINLPARSALALIVHDMSNDALKEGGKYPMAGKDPAIQPVIDNNVRLLAAARAASLPVFFTGHFLRPDYQDVAPGGNSKGYGALQDGTWGAQVIDDLKPEPGEWLIRKGGGYSAFTGTALEKWFRRLGVTTFIIGGAGTVAGVESTVRDARERDFFSIVASDACRGDKVHHDTSLMNMATFAQVGVTDDIVEAIKSLKE